MYKKLKHTAKSKGFFVRFGSLALAAMMVCAVFAGLSTPEQSVKAANVTKTRTGAAANYNAQTIGNTRPDIYWTDATYFDYLTDHEMTYGWLNAEQSGTGFNGSSDDWYPFSSLNSVISSIASGDSSWEKPLYFGNYCNSPGSYDTSTHNGADYVSGMTKSNAFWSYITPKVLSFDYAANNSNGLTRYHQSYQGLMKSSLSNKQLMATNSTPAPYFNASALGSAVRTVSSCFPFRTTKSAGGKTTYYDFDSSEAQDNVYFTWESTGNSGTNDLVKPTKVNYGDGIDNGVEDGLKYFMDPDSEYKEKGHPYKNEKYYGIFPFNNRKNNGDSRTTTTNTRYLYASKGESNWSNLHCRFYNSSGQDIGNYQMQPYLEGGDNRRVKIPDSAASFRINNNSDSDGYRTEKSSDIGYGAYYVSGGTKYVYLSKSNTGWSDSDTRCYFYNSGGQVGTSWPGYSMEKSGENLRVAVPVGATKCKFSNNGASETAEIDLTSTNCAYWLTASGGVNQWTSAPSDAGISTAMTAKRWASKPSDAGKADPGNEALDYGFGIRMDMKFRVPVNGLDDDGKEVKFTYSGDDDLWVYITDKNGNSQLVLDLGGNHKKATGNISFLPTAVVDGTKVKCKATADDVYDASPNKKETEFDFDYSQTYTMSIFYMERGMFESNCKMSFSMTLPENDVVVDKTVNTDGVNSGIKDTDRFKNIVKAESFDFTAYENDAAMADTAYTFSDPVSGSSDKTTDSSTGVFTLKDKQSADFNKRFINGTRVYVNEDYGSANKLRYDTSWLVKDVVNSNAVLGSSAALTDAEKPVYAKKTKSYTLVSTAPGDDVNDYAKLQYSFNNKIKTAPLRITKTVKDYKGNEITPASELYNDTFSALVEIDLGDGSGYKKYDLAYTDSDGNSGTGSTVTLKHGRTVTINGIPVNARYRVTETVPDTYENTTPITSDTMHEGGASVGFINTEKTPNKASAVIQAKKSLKDDKGDDVSFTDGSFTFELYSGTSLLQSKTVSGTTKEVSFDAIEYTDVGNHTYTVKEKQETGDGMVTYDSTPYTVNVSVTKSGTNLSAAVAYVGTTSAATPPTFNNVVKTGSVLVDKSNQAGGKMKGVTFKVYKVAKAVADANSPYDTVVSGGTEAGSQNTGDDGKLTISGLPVYQNNTYNSASPAYQYYALLESATNDADYRLNRVVKYFCFDSPTDLTKEFSYVNGHLRSPLTAGEGMAAAVKTGLLFITLSGVSALAYMLVKRPRKKKLAHLRA